MNPDLSHLPDTKQKEILEILEIIKQEAKPEKVILFGSHTDCKWENDEFVENGVNFGYLSDYDFLIVIKNSDKGVQVIIYDIEDRTAHIDNVGRPHVHEIKYINQDLRNGQYFLTEIIHEGILLFDTGNFQFDKPKVLSPKEEQEKAQGHFDLLYPQGHSFLKGAVFHLSENDLRAGVFSLHQAAECFYTAALLVLRGYHPNTHNLLKLRNYTKRLSLDLHHVLWDPSPGKQGYRLFNLLERGFLDARHHPDYQITAEELKLLIEKVIDLQAIVGLLCKEKIEELGSRER